MKAVMECEEEEELKPLKRQKKVSSKSTTSKSKSLTEKNKIKHDNEPQKKSNSASPRKSKNGVSRIEKASILQTFSSVHNKAMLPYFLPNGSALPVKRLGRCPVCCFDLNSLHGNTPQAHINQCLDTDPTFEKGYCSEDSSCSSSSVKHFRDFKHEPQKQPSQNTVSECLETDLSDCSSTGLSECEKKLPDGHSSSQEKQDTKSIAHDTSINNDQLELTDTSEKKLVQTRISNYFQSGKRDININNMIDNSNTRCKVNATAVLINRTDGSVSKKDNKKPKVTKKKQPQRKECPFYKKIPGTGITVDAFCYGEIAGCTAYFLSHFHSDHYGRLSNRFIGRLYCSQITANLVISRLNVDASKITVLPMLTKTVVDDLNVVLLDANHCPGSVMFLFDLPDGRRMLHVGDFRADESMFEQSCLSSGIISTLYLDTTYCNPRYTFPPQKEAIGFAVNKAREYFTERTLFLCGTYTIGKERVFKSIAHAVGVKVAVSTEKMKILTCLDDKELNKMLTLDYHTAQFHIVSLADMSFKKLHEYLKKYKVNGYNRLVAFKPTGWTFSSNTTSLSDIQPAVSGDVIVFGVPYSEHSSFEELKWFVEKLKPQNIIATVNNGTKKSRDEIDVHFRNWLQH